MTNSFKNCIIEFHIVQSFPVTCLNRDDVGAPKSAIVGGVPRARVSSQCWKRPVRMLARDFGVSLGTRTKFVKDLFVEAFVAAGATAVQADDAAKKMAEAFSSDTLLYISKEEVNALTAYAQNLQFDPSKFKEKEIYKLAQDALNPSVDGLDIVLFGRMVAKATEMNVEAASSFSHAISTHKVENDLDFFTALDDNAEDPGAAHMGIVEFNSATYYRYVSLDLGALGKYLDAPQMKAAIEAFTKALYIAVPSARQSTMAGSSVWDFARVFVRKGQRLQASFDQPVRAREDGYSKPSIEALKAYLDKKEKEYGSVFGKIASYDIGESEFTLDDLIAALNTHVG